MKHEFLDLIKQRRSRYDLTNQSTLPKDEIVQLLEQCVLHTPSPFNSQSTRVLLLCGARQAQFWQLVKHELQSIISPENFAPTEEKLRAFAAAHGTILFFEDQRVVGAIPNVQGPFCVLVQPSQRPDAVCGVDVSGGKRDGGQFATLQPAY